MARHSRRTGVGVDGPGARILNWSEIGRDWEMLGLRRSGPHRTDRRPLPEALAVADFRRRLRGRCGFVGATWGDPGEADALTVALGRPRFGALVPAINSVRCSGHRSLSALLPPDRMVTVSKAGRPHTSQTRMTCSLNVPPSLVPESKA